MERFPAHRAGITCVQACPDPRHRVVVSAAWDKSVKVWDYRRQAVLQTFSTRAGVTGIAFDPDGHVFVTVGADASIQLFAPVHATFESTEPAAPETGDRVKPG